MEWDFKHPEILYNIIKGSILVLAVGLDMVGRKN